MLNKPGLFLVPPLRGIRTLRQIIFLQKNTKIICKVLNFARLAYEVFYLAIRDFMFLRGIE
jgi:hypothetical protein